MEPGWVELMPSGEVTPGGSLRTAAIADLPMAVVAFRDASGKLGVFPEACPHVGKPKATFARGWTESDGLRCKFHGWKYSAAGVCIDIPDAPQGTDFSRYPRAVPFPTRESDGKIWIYIGP